MAKYLNTRILEGEKTPLGELKYKQGSFYNFVNESEASKYFLELEEDKETGVLYVPEKSAENFIESYEVIEPDDVTTIVHATLKNGFKLTESSSAVDPKRYRREIGENICKKKILDRVLLLLSFTLKWCQMEE